jgi:hypothetical protein
MFFLLLDFYEAAATAVRGLAFGAGSSLSVISESAKIEQHKTIPKSRSSGGTCSWLIASDR